MINITDLTEIYDFETNIHNNNIYTEYLQYLILKKIFNNDFGFEIYLAGDFYNRIKFKIPRFSNSFDLISDAMLKEQRHQISEYVLKSLQLEGYEVKLQQENSQAIFKIKTENLALYEEQELEKYPPIVIYINYFNTDYFSGNVTIESLNINKFDVCTRINTINPDIAFTLLAKKIIKSKKISSVELFDLYYFKNLNYIIQKQFFNKAAKGKIPGKLYKISLNNRKPKLNKDFTNFVIDKPKEKYDDIINDRSWIKFINY